MTTTDTPIEAAEFRRVADLVSGWQRPLLLAHARPDGDALGSLLAMRSLLRGLGNEPRAALYEPVPPRYAWLLEDDPMEPVAGNDDPALAQADGVIVLDTCAYTQLDPVADWLKNTSLPKIALDHHVTRDPLADAYLIDEQAAAACLIILDWATAAGWMLDEQARLGLYVGIVTDTGWFRFANADARAHEAASRLVGPGVSPAAIFEELHQRESATRVRLLSAALASMELHHRGCLSVMTITRQMLADAGASAGDTEDVINYPLQIATVAASVLLVENDDGVVRMSLRSKPPGHGRPDLDVAALASTFGGGGHRRAAGARCTGAVAELRRQVIERINDNSGDLDNG
ncbi:MAG: hypothetical protein GY778_30845 [bacterium]|nr:hypothetical protein [bacterium]